MARASIPAHLIKSRIPFDLRACGSGLEPVSRLLKKMFRKNGDRVSDTTNCRYRHYKGIRIQLRGSAAINLSVANVPEDILMNYRQLSRLEDKSHVLTVQCHEYGAPSKGDATLQYVRRK